MVLNCAVSREYRTVWKIGEFRQKDTDSQAFIDTTLRRRGIIAEVSTRENREPPLIINRTVENSRATVQCIAASLEDAATTCDSMAVLVVFYGERLAM